MRIVNMDRPDANAPSVAGQDRIQRLLKARHRRAVAIGELIAQAISGGIGLARGAAAQIAGWRRTARDRRTLMSLSSRELSDMGITSCDIPSILAGTFVRGDWREETSMTFNASPPTPSNDTMVDLGAPRRRRAPAVLGAGTSRTRIRPV